MPPLERGLDVHPLEELEQREGRGVDGQHAGQTQRAQRQDRALAVQVHDEVTQERRHRLEATRLRPGAGQQPVCRCPGRDGEERRHSREMVRHPREEHVGLGFDDERVAEREAEVGERKQLETRIGEPAPKPREHDHLRRPRDDERRPVEELCQRHSGEGRTRGDGERREPRLTPPAGRGDHAVGGCSSADRDTARVAVEKDEAGEERQGDVAAGVRAGDGVEPRPVRTELPGDARREVEQAEGGGDDEHAAPCRLALVQRENDQLRHADRTREDEQAVPEPVDPDDGRPEEDERSESRAGGRRLVVEQGDDGTAMAPMRPKPATISDDHLSESATATAAIPAASPSAPSAGTSSYRAAAKSSVA